MYLDSQWMTSMTQVDLSVKHQFVWLVYVGKKWFKKNTRKKNYNFMCGR